MLIQRRFPAEYEAAIEKLFDEIEDELLSVPYGEEDPMRDAAERLEACATVTTRLSGISGQHVEKAIDLNNRLSAEVRTLREALAELEEEEPEYDPTDRPSGGFDIAALFSDL